MEPSRRSFLAGTVALGSASAFGFAAQEPAASSAAPTLLTLRSAPARVFKGEDPGKEDTESWFTHLVLQAPDAGPWASEELEVALRSAGAVVSRSTFSGSVLAALRTDLAVQGAPCFPFLLRIRGSAPRAARIDGITCAVKVSGPDGSAERPEIEIQLGSYEAKTALLFPFRGRGLVTQGGAADGGHANRSGQFAVDAIGLSQTYAPQTSDDEKNEAACGWGREILAPAAGVVVRARTDRPDQPVPGTTNPEFLLPEFKGGGDPGNHVVIDHGNGEFSLICHLQAGSVLVEQSQRVEQGEILGLLGNSGDTNFPHVHYQLMDGPDWMRCDALPFRFQNGPKRLVRGTYFDAQA